MKEGVVVQGFDNIRSTMGHLQNFTTVMISLNFPVIRWLYFCYAFAGSHINAFNLRPVFDARLGHSKVDFQQFIKIQRWYFSFTANDWWFCV